jgi:manganese transport protein
MQKPVLMVILGGIATFVMLLPVCFAALHFRYRRLPAELRSSRAYDLWLWVSILAIMAVGIYGLYQVIQG